MNAIVHRDNAVTVSSPRLSADPGGSDFSIAIIGGGPRALHCLDSLAKRWAQTGLQRPIDVVIYEPSGDVGPGNIYDPQQPAQLRMNFASGNITAWTTADHEQANRLRLTGWLQQHAADQASDGSFVPRSLVGHYLRDCFELVRRELPASIRLTVRPVAVDSILRNGHQWSIQTLNDQQSFDEVLITTGHGGWRRPSVPPSVSKATITIPAYPVDKQLTLTAVPPGCVVATRGFGLTWLDVVLTLTEGRGGRFTGGDDSWQYHPSGLEPAKIYPYCRSGRPMLAKPEKKCLDQTSHLERLFARARRELAQLQRPQSGFDFTSDLWPRVTQIASEAIAQIGLVTDVASWFDQWCRHPMIGRQAVAAMKQSYRVAHGDCPPDAAWALGQAWRQLYPALVQQISHSGLATDAWPAFRTVAAEMERIAFGPPAENLGRGLALIEAGWVDTELLVDSAAATEMSDVTIEATIPAPWDLAANSPLMPLLRNGTLRTLAGTQAIEVDRCGRPLDRHGCAIEGLAILGRVTEGCILGNDTLSRSLHDHPLRWAETVITRIATVGPTEPTVTGDRRTRQ